MAEVGTGPAGRASGGAADAAVRPATPADVPAIAAVQSRAWRSAYADLLGPEAVAALTPQALTPAWAAAVGTPPSSRHAVLVATAGGLVVGFAASAPSEDPDAEGEGELATLAVDPSHQRAGHGSRLLAATVDLLLDAGTTAMLAWAPEADAPRLAFLESAGMHRDGGRRSFQVTSAVELVEIRLGAALARG